MSKKAKFREGSRVTLIKTHPGYVLTFVPFGAKGIVRRVAEEVKPRGKFIITKKYGYDVEWSLGNRTAIFYTDEDRLKSCPETINVKELEYKDI